MLFGRTFHGDVSRFVGEIGAGNIERQPAESDETNCGAVTVGGERAGFAVRGFSGDRARSRPAHARRARPPDDSERGRREAATPTVFRIGDAVKHKVFGGGLITRLDYGGKDALLEIAFDSIGTKRFMLNSVAQYLTKS
jgi:DNA helicase-2/ATP-dependent DNA helicase PcrA